jgi:hypothetical protein
LKPIFIIAGAVVLFFLIKKNATAAPAPKGNAGGGAGGSGALDPDGLIGALLGTGKAGATNIKIGGSGSGSGTSLTGGAINVGPLLEGGAKAVKDALKHISDSLGRAFTGDTTPTLTQFADANAPIPFTTAAGNEAVFDAGRAADFWNLSGGVDAPDVETDFNSPDFAFA